MRAICSAQSDPIHTNALVSHAVINYVRTADRIAIHRGI